MRAIYKFEIERISESYIEIPGLCGVLKVGFQKDKLFVWAEVDLDKQDEYDEVFVQIKGTGEAYTTEAIYVETVFEGPYVWHIFLYSSRQFKKEK